MSRDTPKTPQPKALPPDLQAVPLDETAFHDQLKTAQYNLTDIQSHLHSGTDTNPIDAQTCINRVRYILYRCLDAAVPVSVATVGGDIVMPFSGSIEMVAGTVDTAGTTGTMKTNVLLNGSSIFTTNTINIASTAKTSRTNAVQPTITTFGFNTGDIFTVSITNIQSTPAKGFTLAMRVIESSP